MTKVLLSLGRVSNLPTVWTNAMAGAWLAGGPESGATLAVSALALSLFYTGGMFLNDAFDREIDARERPERPIPSGHISAASVFALGGGQLLAGGALLVHLGTRTGSDLAIVGISAASLAAAIVLYDAAHRANPLAPWIMGACRALVYVCAAAVSGPDAAWRLVAPAAAAIAAYTAAVTYVAAVEATDQRGPRWPLALLFAGPLAVVASTDVNVWGLGLAAASAAWSVVAVRRASASQSKEMVRDGVTRLIAGMSILDAAWIAAGGAPAAAGLALAALPATRLLQRRIAGT